jgi:hypothetical protein
MAPIRGREENNEGVRDQGSTRKNLTKKYVRGTGTRLRGAKRNGTVR